MDLDLLSWAGKCHRSRFAVLSARQREDVLKRKRSEAALEQVRGEGGKFAAPPPKRKLASRPATVRISREAELVQERYDAYIAATQAQFASLKAEHTEQLQRLQRRIAQQHKQLLTIRLEHKRQLKRQETTRPGVARGRKKIQGGNSKPTLIKLAKAVENLLSFLFSTAKTRQSALYQHYLRNPQDYRLILDEAVNNQEVFQRSCSLHPDWLRPHQQAVVKAIEDAWTLDLCLAIQIHCKVGHSEKWQYLINLLSKTYNSQLKQWVPREILGKGSKVFLPLLKSKNRVNSHREELHAIIPLIQNKDGTACWANLLQLIEEAVRLDRAKGYLQSRVHLIRDRLWIHWGGDAAGWVRGMSHSIWGFKLLGNQRVVTHSPKDMRVALTFEGKDKYSTYKEYLEPFQENMKTLTEVGIKIETTEYEVEQTCGADYVLMAELLGHYGASGAKGCCLCEQVKENYGKTYLKDGRRVPLPATPRTTESMAMAAHRPWTTGPGVQCQYCHEPFPDQNAVDQSPAPQTKAEITKFQQTHAGIRFGTPPLFKLPITAYAICILHLLLRLMAITFLRTIVDNLNTPEKTDAVNALIKALHLGCKKVEQRKASGDTRKDTENINFIGREARVLLHPTAYNAFLDIAITDDDKRADARAIWDNLAAAYSELLQPLNNPADKVERTAKSVVVQDKLVAYVESFSAHVGAGRATLYMHLAMDHVPDMVRRFPIDISDLSQQFVEHKLKQGKTDMQLFTNKRLVDERQQKGRNLQVMAKGRERLALEQSVSMPATRNERRYLGDGSKAAEQTIERAQRRGQLESRSKAQLETKLKKLGPDITRVFLGYKEIMGNLTSSTSLSEGEGGSASARLMVESDSLTPVPDVGGAAEGGGVEAGAAAGADGPASRETAATRETAAAGRGRGAAPAGRGTCDGWTGFTRLPVYFTCQRNPVENEVRLNQS
ncbi:hypothetical protein KFL_002680090 [Klebsormidium nitens]|uniref:Uncharacterized protein n=1 Tax=Klebsormidium nitens TaxID=105231 RepID=A0A1Y1I6C4_KLENI|nr:hypothetical protein KFL_002680090 [Klebsormidium nitens]|eukprot:GAQ86063.1 hypothetical protein KFL_002680090 [Klebsormidium nitens]